MNLLKRFPFSVPLVLLILLNFIDEAKPTLLLSSLLAMSGGLMMGKMTLGGLMMMLMAANQQQNGQNLFRNLGTIPAPGPPTGLSVPTGDISAATQQQSEGSNILADIQNLIVKRSIRQKREVGVDELKNSSIPMKIDPELQYRVMRQVANSDPLGCLPQALCGISATPPSTQTGFLNDYSYLLKTVFTRDEDTDDLDRDDDAADIDKFDELKNSYTALKKQKTKQVTKSDVKTRTKVSSPTSQKKTTNTKTKTKKKKPQNDESSEEEIPLNEEEMDKLMAKEAFEMEHLANEELLDEDPDFLPYAMRDAGALKLGPFGERAPPGRPQDIPQPDEEEEYVGMAPSDLNKMSDAELDDMLTRINGPRPGPPGGGGPSRYKQPPPASTGSFLSKLMPKVSMGFTPGQGGNFGEDPFFSGFKRSMNSEGFTQARVRPATEEEQKLFKEMIVRRRKRMDFILSKKKELSEIKDPVEKFRIAADFGERVKSPRQCRILFNNCPFNYTQVLEMIAGLRKVVLGQPLTSPESEKGREKDTVVALAPVTTPLPPPQPQGVKNIINFNTGGTGGMAGVTSIQHELPNGEKVEINLQMTNTGKNKKRRVNRPKVSSSTASPSPTVISKPKRKKPVDEQDLFDEDPPSASMLPSLKTKTQSSLGSLESLKATMLAIEKINNVTVERRKQGKPVNYSNVLADLNLGNQASIKSPTVAVPTLHPHPVTRPPIRKQKKPKPQIVYNIPQKTSALASALAILSSSTLNKGVGHSEDDEVEETLPTRRPSTVRVKRPPFPPKNKKARIPSSTTPKPGSKKPAASGSKTKVKGQNQKTNEDQEAKEEDEVQDDEPSEESEEEEEEEDDYSGRPYYDDDRHDVEFRSGIPQSEEPGEIEKIVINVPIEDTDSSAGVTTQTFVKQRSPSLRKSKQRRWRKPKKLYPEDVVEFRRTLPL